MDGVEEGALVEIHSVEEVSAEIAIILGMMMVPELSEAAVGTASRAADAARASPPRAPRSPR